MTVAVTLPEYPASGVHPEPTSIHNERDEKNYGASKRQVLTVERGATRDDWCTLINNDLAARLSTLDCSILHTIVGTEEGLGWVDAAITVEILTVPIIAAIKTIAINVAACCRQAVRALGNCRQDK